MRLIKSVFILSVIAVVLGFALFYAKNQSQNTPVAAVIRSAPEFTFKDSQGHEVPLRDLRGSTLVIHFGPAGVVLVFRKFLNG